MTAVNVAIRVLLTQNDNFEKVIKIAKVTSEDKCHN